LILAGWASPPLTQSLNVFPAEIHVWRAVLDLDATELERLRKVLSPDEQARAGRFYFERDRQRFIASRGILREILSRYVKHEAGRLEFSYNQFGKPRLALEVSEDGIYFNLSHSNGLALCAVSRSPEIGVDLELVKRDFPFHQIARHFFSPHEIRTLQSLPEAMKCEAFFNGWTRKEAFVKACGEGLSLPLNQFTVPLETGEHVILLQADGNSKKTSHWTFKRIIPADGYIAALAAEGRNWQVKCWQWSYSVQSNTIHSRPSCQALLNTTARRPPGRLQSSRRTRKIEGCRCVSLKHLNTPCDCSGVR
jgi:4'-phosphopantetheinyl transferase